MEYRVTQNNDGSKSSKSVVYIRNCGYSPLAMVDTSGATPEYSYFLRDHLGSSLMTVDDSANLVAGASHGRHDPWGQPWKADGTENDLKEDSRGFTGHENIASAGLIHMNGRVYDPMIGQFLGPDRFTQNASQMVGLNRYAYIGNSPVNGTDPSGWTFFESLRDTLEGRNFKRLRRDQPKRSFGFRSRQTILGRDLRLTREEKRAILINNGEFNTEVREMALRDGKRLAMLQREPAEFLIRHYIEDSNVKMK
jgi:RHS repeat-associated protein